MSIQAVATGAVDCVVVDVVVGLLVPEAGTGLFVCVHPVPNGRQIGSHLK